MATQKKTASPFPYLLCDSKKKPHEKSLAKKDVRVSSLVIPGAGRSKNENRGRRYAVCTS